MKTVCKRTDWYKNNIEEGVRDIVKHLRNNGINTTCSCEHEMYVEGDIIRDGFMKQLDELLFNYFYEHKVKRYFWYSIDIHLERLEGHVHNFFVIKLKEKNEKTF